MESLSVDGLDLTREPDLGRDPRLVIGWLLDTNVTAELIRPAASRG
jgi:hypothetical protein